MNTEIKYPKIELIFLLNGNKEKKKANAAWEWAHNKNINNNRNLLVDENICKSIKIQQQNI